ncbi:hypothetical protein L3X38_005494 [Prunus dulcis]|uniref:Reverse transcriptase Ty1/copia-type domain-containing protein n=1 Tax=Prunus dulcis TaxID=3755 RepID=A0AAD4ZQW8_PRUDU|nr:hypothetical protein L3X38_005494 [Prunus dulcis]
MKIRNLSGVFARCNFSVIEPESFEEAMNDVAWKKAMKEEITVIKKNSTWELVDSPSDKDIIAHKGWFLHQLDVKPAFLNGVLNEEEMKVYKSKKTLYGLKQAPRAWYVKIDAYFINNGFQRCKSEATLYPRTEATRPDIMYATSLLSRFMNKPTQIHLGTAKRIMSKSAIAMAKNPFFHGRTKHIAIKHHFIRDAVEEKDVVYCRTEEQVVDIFTITKGQLSILESFDGSSTTIPPA